MKSRFFFLFTAFLGLSCTTQRMAERPFEFESAPLSGMVYDTHSNPVPAAVLSVDGKLITRSDVYGRFLIPGLSRGSHSVTAERSGYEPAHLEFEFLNKTHILYIRMISFEAILADAESAIEDGNWSVASRLLDRAGKIETDGGLPLVKFLSASLAYRKNDFESALDLLTGILDSGYRFPAVYLFLADIHEKGLNDRPAAAEYLERYLDLKNDPSVERRLRELK